MKKIIWQVKSRHAIVTCINNGRGIVVEKQISPNVVNAKNAGWVNETSMYFRKKLRENGVLLAEPYLCYEESEFAMQVSPYVGLDLEKIFREGKGALQMITKLLISISGILQQETPEVGIDARLSNFCLAPNEEIYYVDTFPPLVKYNGEYIVHFPNPTNPEIIHQEFDRKFDPMGILRRLRFSILEQDVGFNEKQILLSIFQALGSDLHLKTQNYFEGLVDHLDVREALCKLTLDDPDGIRELALKFMPKKGEVRENFLREIFDLSSNFCPIEITKERRIERIQNLLSSQLK